LDIKTILTLLVEILKIVIQVLFPAAIVGGITSNVISKKSAGKVAGNLVSAVAKGEISADEAKDPKFIQQYAKKLKK